MEFLMYKNSLYWKQKFTYLHLYIRTHTTYEYVIYSYIFMQQYKTTTNDLMLLATSMLWDKVTSILWDLEQLLLTNHMLLKQVGCFNHRVVALKLEWQWLLEGWNTNCLRQPERQLASFMLQPQYTDNLQNICEGIITNALQSCSKNFHALESGG